MAKKEKNRGLVAVEPGFSLIDENMLKSRMGMRTNSWTRLEDASCILQKHKLPKPWKHSMI